MSKKELLFLIVLLFNSGCYYEDIPRNGDNATCIDSDLIISALSQGTTGCGQPDGSITATATGGTGNYLFSIDEGQTKKASGTFTGLLGGNYRIIVFDGNVCSDTTEVEVKNANTDFSVTIKSSTPDTQCLSDNGTVELSATGGSGTYNFTVGSSVNSTGIFSGLAGGSYTSMVSDGNCTLNISFEIASGSSASYLNDIVPILNAKCNFSTCHGDGGPQTNLTIYNNVRSRAQDIKSRTSSGNMPKQPKPGGSLTDEQIKLIACWVNEGAANN